ncbi:hypothetical protein RMR21_025595 (plasmid) [Agrobacterium sp. rho-8.1]|nr:hypothetical protein [Agrobacterium sp. rho-8.1]
MVTSSLKIQAKTLADLSQSIGESGKIAIKINGKLQMMSADNQPAHVGMFGIK